MADTVAQLTQKLLDAMEAVSNDPNTDPAQARREMAQQMAQAIRDFVVGRTTQVQVTVTGTDATGSPVTGTGTGTGVIQ